MNFRRMIIGTAAALLLAAGGSGTAQAESPSVSDWQRPLWPELTADREYLSHVPLPSHIEYTPIYNRRDGQVMPAGQLRENRKDGIVSAWAAGLTLSEGDAAVLQKLLSGDALLQGTEQIQDMLIKWIAAAREKSGDNIPFNAAVLKISDFQSLHAFHQGNRYVQTASARIWLMSEGFVLPQFVKVYIFPRNGKFNLLAVIASDGEKQVMEPAADELAFSLTDSRSAGADDVHDKEAVHAPVR